MLILFGGPIVFPLAIGLVYVNAKPSELPITIIDQDNSSLSETIIDALDDSQYLRVYRVTFDETQGRKDLQQSKVEGVITIPYQFSSMIQQKRHPEIQIDLNTMNILTSNYINSSAVKTLGAINAGIMMNTLQKSGIPAPSVAEQWEAFRVNTDRFYNPETNYLKCLWPGIVATVLQQIFLMVIALMFSFEFEKNLFPELLHKTKSASFMIFAKSLPYILVMMLIWGVMLLTFFPIFKIPITGSFSNVFIFSLLFMISLLAIGVMVSAFCKTMVLSTDILMIIATPSFIVGGYTWPISQMPGIMQGIANILPITPFLSGYRKILFMNCSLSDVLPEIKHLGVLILVFGFLGWAVLKIKIRDYLKKEKIV
jgi:ABC-2 type transport system permease protein